MVHKTINLNTGSNKVNSITYDRNGRWLKPENEDVNPPEFTCNQCRDVYSFKAFFIYFFNLVDIIFIPTLYVHMYYDSISAVNDIFCFL